MSDKSIPIYVTRPMTDGATGYIYINGYLVFLAVMLVMFNIIGWSVYGLIELIGKVI